MGARLDLTGQKFNRLTAIEPTAERSGSKVVWRFACDCGKQVCVAGKDVKSGNTQSCGCLNGDVRKEIALASRVAKVCPVCHKAFTCKLSHALKTTYCSKACVSADYSVRFQGAANPNYKGPEHAEHRRTELRVQQQLWRDSNKDQIREANRNTKARRKRAIGSHTEDDIKALRIRQAGLCAACRCGLHGDGHIDHVIALARGGTNYVGNLQILCAQCNLRKKVMLPIEYRVRVLAGTNEEAEQSRVMLWASINVATYPALAMLFHSANGGYRTKTTAARMQAIGVKKGVPDLCLPVARGAHIGLWIEMKVGRNRPTPEQDAWLAGLREEGHMTIVAYGWEEAVAAVMRYLRPEAEA